MLTDNTIHRLVAIALLVVVPTIGFVMWMHYRVIAGSSSQYKTTPKPPSAQKADDTVNWNTYKSASLGVEFEYPRNYLLVEDSRSNRVRLLTNAGVTSLLEIGAIETLDSVETWWSSNSTNYVPHVMTTAQLNGYPAYLFVNISRDVQTPTNWYIVPRPGYLLQISFPVPFDLSLYQNLSTQDKATYENYNEQFGKNQEAVIDEILATFRLSQ